MPDCSPGVSQNGSDMNMLNQKLQYDGTAQIQHQSLVDNQVNARALQSLQVRSAEDAQTIKQLAALNMITASQTGQTENEQTVDPMRTGAGDQTAANVMNLATTMTPIIASALATAISEALTAILPVVVTAAGGASAGGASAGGASTPSQTKPPVTA